jgi:hypothetical protein
MKTKPSIFILALSLSALTACQTAPQKNAPSDPVANTINKPITPPLWYETHSHNAPGYWLGYGEGETLDQAKTQARADLSRSLRTQIQSTTAIQTQMQEGDTAVRINVDQQIQEVSQTELTDLTTLNVERRVQDERERYYVVLGYDHRPLALRVSDKLKSLRVPADPNPSDFWQTMPWMQTLKAQQLASLPKFALHYQSPHYWITEPHSQTAFQIKSHELPDLYPQLETAVLKLQFEPQRPAYAPESLYRVRISVEQPGYLSYIHITSQGETLRMLDNKPVKPEQEWLFPDPVEYDGLVTELPAGLQQSRDLHWLMVCPDQRDLSRLEPISTQAHQSYASYRLGELESLSQGCQVQTQTQLIRR